MTPGREKEFPFIRFFPRPLVVPFLLCGVLAAGRVLAARTFPARHGSRAAPAEQPIVRGAPPGEVPALADSAGDERRVEYGIALALGEDWAPAESAFVAVLSHRPADARALTNLGNLQLIQGNTRAALAFYDQADLADSSDAGIRLRSRSRPSAGGGSRRSAARGEYRGADGRRAGGGISDSRAP